MSYFDRLQKEYGEMGSGGVGNVLQQAQSQAQEKLGMDESTRDQITGITEGKLGKLVGEKIGGKFLMDKAIGGAKKYIAEPRRKRLNAERDSKFKDADAKGSEVGEIESKGMDRVAGGANADGSLKANPSSAREGMPDDIKFREGDITPEDIAGGDNSALTTSNKTRYRALDDEGQASVKDKIANNDNYTTKTQTDTDVNSGTITAEEGQFQRNRSKFIEQDAIGDAEGQGATLGGANPMTGGSVGGTGRPVNSTMGDRDEIYNRQTGLSAEEGAKVDSLTGEADVLATAGAEAGSATALEIGLEAIPVIGEIAGIGLGLGEGIKDAAQSHKEQLADTANINTDNLNIDTAMKYAGFNRQNFGSMALPSFDTSKSSALLQQ